MAVQPPTGPYPPNDGSNIFRRGMMKPASKPTRPTDDATTPAPTEPADALDLDDEDALFATPKPGQAIHDLDAALSGVMLDEPPDSEPPISAILLDEMAAPPDDPPVSGILLDDDPTALGSGGGPADDPPVSGILLDDALAPTPAPPSAADSSIFAGGPLPHTGVGSGWLDPSAPAEPTSGDLWGGALPSDLPMPADPPSTAKYADAADLFAELRGDTPASDSVWLETDPDEAEATGRVSESEVRSVLDATRPEAGEAVDDASDLHTSRSSLMNIDLDEEASNPETVDIEAIGGDDDASAIGGDGDATEFDSGLADAESGGSSIFDRLPAVDAEDATDDDNVDFNIPVPGDAGHESSLSGRLPGVPDADPEVVAADLFGDPSDDAGRSVGIPLDDADSTDDRTPAIAAAVAAGALGGVGAAKREKRDQSASPTRTDKKKSTAKVPPPAKRTPPADADDKPEPKGKKRGGIGGVLAGLATGLALGVGGFAVVYLTGLIPNEKKGTASVSPQPGGDSRLAGQVEQLTTDLKEANDKAAKAEKALEPLRKELASRQALVDEKDTLLKQAQGDLTVAKKDAADTRAALEPLTKEVETAKKEATDAKKLAAAAAKERDDVRTALDTAKKDAEDKGKMAADAEAKRTDAEKKLKTADDAIATMLKDLKANKLLDEKADASKLPEAVQKLAAVATSGDAKKAADALLAAQKERDTARAALTKAEADAKTATDAANKAKTDADKKVADAMKAADDKVKTAVDDATKELKKQLTDATAAAKKAQDDLTAAKAAAKTEAEAAAKVKLDAAVARAETAEKSLDTKVKALEADFAAKLAEARAGVVKVVPAEMEASEKAARSYADGVAAYRNGRYADAEAAFAAATASQPADARYWYYLGLARTQTGTAGAADAFKKGAEMESRNKPSVKVIDAAFERLTFADKQRVNQYRQ